MATALATTEEILTIEGPVLDFALSGATKRAFISHAAVEKDFAEPLARALWPRQSIFVERDVVSPETLASVLKEVSLAILVLSDSYFESPWSLRELDATLEAFNRQDLAIAVVLLDITEGEALQFLSARRTPGFNLDDRDRMRVVPVPSPANPCSASCYQTCRNRTPQRQIPRVAKVPAGNRRA